MCPACLIHVKQRVNSTKRFRYTQTHYGRTGHKRAIAAQVMNMVEKTIYELKKTIYSLETLFMALR